MPDEPIKAVEMMRSIRQSLEDRFRGLPLEEWVKRIQEEVRQHPLGRQFEARRKTPERTAP